MALRFPNPWSYVQVWGSLHLRPWPPRSQGGPTTAAARRHASARVGGRQGTCRNGMAGLCVILTQRPDPNATQMQAAIPKCDGRHACNHDDGRRSLVQPPGSRRARRRRGGIPAPIHDDAASPHGCLSHDDGSTAATQAAAALVRGAGRGDARAGRASSRGGRGRSSNACPRRCRRCGPCCRAAAAGTAEGVKVLHIHV